ncbi:FadR family transcriptional regulator [Muricomes sp. OA1]|uniref:FadR family transcriptional regulator n=1 Tax=Hungatella hathewayi TaxID=154046 RepID=A0A3E2X1C5_9FIRM|nr:MULTISPECIES: FadR/GntR family transcriptional regulator [Clostridia]MEE0201355.1 FadR/GntR family transcriptional regulator [Muricomes sp.]MCH1971096.1 FadR family transcriptional regulator [Muricomes sp. OA1]MRM88727.1 FadR family transcriptional regulator [Faecalicatena contorta]RGC35087.1 FadR family transcriptional regulator [Hungatella hathewayi]GKH34389.1 GntR family transcriptional regulator [Faecalicatena contorta]
MGIKPIKRVNVGEQVLLQLKKMLIDGEWAPGSKIPSENELAELFEVSRITVRQALQKLNALGLIETRLGDGSYVRNLDIGDSMNALIPVMYLGDQSDAQVFEFRQIIETGCTKLAVNRATKKDIEELKIILAEMVGCKDKSDIKGFSKADLKFHFKIAQITRNALFIKTNSILQDVLEQSMDTVIDKMGFENGIYYHQQIIKAFENRNEEEAVKMMNAHIEKNYEYFN